MHAYDIKPGAAAQAAWLSVLTNGASADCATSATRAAHSISNPHVSFMPSSAAGHAALLAGGIGYVGGACDACSQPQRLLQNATKGRAKGMLHSASLLSITLS